MFTAWANNDVRFVLSAASPELTWIIWTPHPRLNMRWMYYISNAWTNNDVRFILIAADGISKLHCRNSCVCSCATKRIARLGPHLSDGFVVIPCWATQGLRACEARVIQVNLGPCGRHLKFALPKKPCLLLCRVLHRFAIYLKTYKMGLWSSRIK